MAGYDLIPRFDSRKSFYSKATVYINENGDQLLRSYVTNVARINRGAKPEVYGTYSNTTLRHIKEFLKQNGFMADTSKQIMKDYGF
jgi:hypothetical protein